MVEAQSWGEMSENEPVSDVTIKGLEKMCAELKALKKRAKKTEEVLKKRKAAVTAQSEKIMKVLAEIGKSKYQSEVGLVYTSTTFSVSTPKSETDKKAFFDWAQEKGIYYAYATVNSKSLASLYKEQLESEGETFEMPGVGKPFTIDKLNFRAKK